MSSSLLRKFLPLPLLDHHFEFNYSFQLRSTPAIYFIITMTLYEWSVVPSCTSYFNYFETLRPMYSSAQSQGLRIISRPAQSSLMCWVARMIAIKSPCLFIHSEYWRYTQCCGLYSRKMIWLWDWQENRHQDVFTSMHNLICFFYDFLQENTYQRVWGQASVQWRTDP